MSDVTLHQHIKKKSAEGRNNIPRWSHQLLEIHSLSKVLPFIGFNPIKERNLKEAVIPQYGRAF
jgi:hypothetical protein